MLLKKLFLSRLLTVLMLVVPICGYGEGQDSINYKLRKTIVLGGNGVAYTSTMVGLYALWYKDYELEKFHFFNDNKEWNQMDKVGHAYSCYYEGVAGIEMMKWAGYSKKQYSIIGGSYGFFIQTGIEVLDGFSTGWGASMGDVAANAVGSGLAISQSLLWDEQRIHMKYGFSRSYYDTIRPNVLGSNLPERILKDYNGQTYWLSANLYSFMPESNLPKWLNVAVGYGANGMIGGHSNIYESNGIMYDRTDVVRSRQFYLSPDIDLTKIPTNKKWQHGALVVLNAIKFPLPALEYDTHTGFRGHWFKF